MIRASVFALVLTTCSAFANAQQGQVNVQTNRWSQGPVNAFQGTGVRILKIVGQPIIERTTGKQLLYLVVDQYGRQVGAVIESTTDIDHGFEVTKWDGEIDSSLVTVVNWTLGRTVQDGQIGNIYGPNGDVRFVVGSEKNRISSSTVAPTPATYSMPAPAYPTYSYPMHYSAPIQYSSHATVAPMAGTCNCR